MRPQSHRNPLRTAMATLAVAAVTISSAWAGVEAHADQSDLLGKAASALAVPSGYQVVQVRGGSSLTDSLRAAVKTAANGHFHRRASSWSSSYPRSS